MRKKTTYTLSYQILIATSHYMIFNSNSPSFIAAWEHDFFVPSNSNYNQFFHL